MMPAEHAEILRLLQECFDSPADGDLWVERLRTASHGSPNAFPLGFTENLESLRGRMERSGPAVETDSAAAECSELSRCLLAWLYDGGFLGSLEDHIECARSWNTALNQFLTFLSAPLYFRRILPGQRFDHDRMESVASESGHHLKVARPLSWIVCQNTDDGFRVLRRGRVVST